MEKKIIVKDFGPIKELNFILSDFNLLIGPQASGKSTLAKAVYFFLSLKDDLTQRIFDYVEGNEQIEDANTNFKKRIRAKFVSFWGTTKHLKPFEITFFYSSQKWVRLFLKDGYVNAQFSREFANGLKKAIATTGDFLEQRSHIQRAYLNSADLMAQESQKRAFYKKIEEIINQIFEENQTPLYIPAGRSLLATLSDPIQTLILSKLSAESQSDLDPYLLDYPLKAFIERVSNLKVLFTKSLSEIIEDKKKYSTMDVKIDFESLQLAKQLITSILRGEYRYDREGNDRLVLKDENAYVKLSFASSGQQESIWILLQIFVLILNKTPSMVIIEEPEAHLYPEAQREIVSLIALLSKLNGNRLLITTHSPYILTSINNLLYAHNVGEINREGAKKVINTQLWLNSEKLKAYHIEEGKVRSIIDPELKLIQAEELDRASRIINEEFGQLMNLEYEV